MFLWLKGSTIGIIIITAAGIRRLHFAILRCLHPGGPFLELVHNHSNQYFLTLSNFLYFFLITHQHHLQNNKPSWIHILPVRIIVQQQQQILFNTSLDLEQVSFWYIVAHRLETIFKFYKIKTIWWTICLWVCFIYEVLYYILYLIKPFYLFCYFYFIYGI